MLQKITFTNTTDTKFEGLRLILSKVARGVHIYSSSLSLIPASYEVIYGKTIDANETISFDLVYFDPLRRNADSINPIIKAEVLMKAVPDSLPVNGTLVPLRSTRMTEQGPQLEWNSVPRTVYVVEYSDDGGQSWLSAVHRLGTNAPKMFWIDRGQPETETKPIGHPNSQDGRSYRVKRL